MEFVGKIILMKIREYGLNLPSYNEFRLLC